MKSKKPSLGAIFLTVFIDLVGFGIILPMTPYLARHYNADGVGIGGLMTLYSLMQFAFSPFWGSLSDRIGRRPIIAISLLGGALSYVGFAFAESLTMLYVFRGLSGFFAANISAAQAYISDITTKENRSKGMGVIGAAFGLGFVFGPVLGAGLVLLGEHWGGEGSRLAFQVPTLVAASLSLINFLWVILFLPESLNKNSALEKTRRGFSGILKVLRTPILSSLIMIFFLSTLSMALMEAMFFPFLQDRFNWGLKLSSLSFAMVGIMMAITQGFFIRKWIPAYGERKVLLTGLILMTFSYLAMGLSYNVILLGLACLALAVGNGCMRPPLMGMVSLIALESEQGFVMGIAHSFGAIGRIIGPLVSGWAYDNFSKGSPFFIASLTVLVASLMVFVLFVKLPEVKRDNKGK